MANSAWIEAYGPAGEPTPYVFDTVLVGGARSGERIHADGVGARLRVPRPVKLDMYKVLTKPDELPPVWDQIDDYERRACRPCWSAAPVWMWVLVGLSNENAAARLQEWQGELPTGHDVDAEFAGMQHEDAMRRLRELRDELRDQFDDD